MFSNPFSLVLGCESDVFFGRDRILRLFDLAMIDSGSDMRAMIITGARGMGKTSLLEQLSIRAEKKKRRIINLLPENTIKQLIHELSGLDGVTDNLQSILLDACAKSRKGLLIIVDEIQKAPIEDVSSLCNAFQMASRKGYDIMLAVAGLPYAYGEITRHEGCTYLRRASHEEIGLFTWDEAEDALKKVFSSINGLQIDKSFLDRINESSFGHPYLMQLLGYHLILQVNNHNPDKKHTVTEDELAEAEKNALLSYEQRALIPLFEELPENEKQYLIKMSLCMGKDRLSSTSEIAKALGKSQSKLSRNRAYLIDHGIIASTERGKEMFCIPYLSDFVKKDRGVTKTIDVVRQRRV